MARYRHDARRTTTTGLYKNGHTASKATRAPGVLNKHIPCPDCGAEAGDFCFNSSGERTSTAHASRRRLAVRQANAERGLLPVTA